LLRNITINNLFSQPKTCFRYIKIHSKVSFTYIQYSKFSYLIDPNKIKPPIKINNNTKSLFQRACIGIVKGFKAKNLPPLLFFLIK
jgi:hypothetical protein